MTCTDSRCISLQGFRGASRELETSQQARDQVARFMQKNGLPGKLQDYDDEMLQFNEVVVVVDSEPQLQMWVDPTKPFQIALLAGIHEHGSAPGIADHIRYVVIRAKGAEGVIGGALSLRTGRAVPPMSNPPAAARS